MLLMWATDVHARSPHKGSGTTGATFLNVHPGARYEAQGGAAVADATGIDALYWNPAGLAETKRKKISFAHNNYIQGIRNNYLAYVVPSQRNGVAGFSFYHVDLGDIPRTEVDAAGNAVVGLGNFTAADMALAASYGKALFEKCSVGITGKYIRSRIESVDADAWALDGGIRFQLVDALSVGLAVKNFGSKIKFRSQKDDLPLTYKFGMAYQTRLASLRCRIGADMSIPAQNKIYYNGGAEVWWNDFIAIRVGHDNRNQDVGEWFTAGFGIQLKEWNFDYAFTPYGHFNKSHRLAFGYQF